ncbi:MAG: sulfatase, partial [Opitutae bacterium]
EKTDQLDNTLIVFAADQGIAWGQKGFQQKIAPYDANNRSAPCFIRTIQGHSQTAPSLRS